jgi:hypothetical protein
MRLCIALLISSLAFAQQPDWQAISDLGQKAYAAGNYVEAETQFKEALTLAESSSENNVKVIDSLRQLAGVYRNYVSSYSDPTLWNSRAT